MLIDTTTLRRAIELWDEGKSLTDIRSELRVSYFVLRAYFAAVGINKRQDVCLNHYSHGSTDIGSEDTFQLEEFTKMIKKEKNGYKVISHSGKTLGGPYKTRSEAVKRLKQVEYFKHKDKKGR